MDHSFQRFLNHLYNITSQPYNSSSAIISCEDSFVSFGNLHIGPFIREMVIENIKIEFSPDKATQSVHISETSSQKTYLNRKKLFIRFKENMKI
jgi:hypothetical protein